MKQVIVKSLSGLLPAAEAAAAGAAQLGLIIGLKQNDEVAIRTDMGVLSAAVAGYEQAKVVLTEKREAGRSMTATTREFLTLTRDILKPRFGTQYSEGWNVTGFVDSLMVPDALNDVQYRIQQMRAFLAANPETELAALNITAARAESLFNDLNAAMAAINRQQTIVGEQKDARDAAAEKLRIRLRWLINELSQLLGPLDQRWLTFGFNMPDADETPDIPENISAVLVGPNAMSVKWPASARAAYYRVWKRVKGVDQELIAVGSPGDLDFTIEALPNNASIEIAVSAVNNGGESGRSAVVTVQTH